MVEHRCPGYLSGKKTTLCVHCSRPFTSHSKEERAPVLLNLEVSLEEIMRRYVVATPPFCPGFTAVLGDSMSQCIHCGKTQEMHTSPNPAQLPSVDWIERRRAEENVLCVRLAEFIEDPWGTTERDQAQELLNLVRSVGIDEVLRRIRKEEAP